MKIVGTAKKVSPSTPYTTRGRGGRERERGGYYLVSDGTVGGDVGAVERSLERRQTVVDVDDADGDVD